MSVDRVPIIRLSSTLLVVLQGDLLDAQASQLSGDVLHAVRQHGVRSLVVDVSGVPVIDSHLCHVIAKLVGAASLMGTRSVLCGLTPEIVVSLLEMGLDVPGLETALNLEDALRKLRIVIYEIPDEDEEPTSEALDTEAATASGSPHRQGVT